MTNLLEGASRRVAHRQVRLEFIGCDPGLGGLGCKQFVIFGLGLGSDHRTRRRYHHVVGQSSGGSRGFAGDRNLCPERFGRPGVAVELCGVRPRKPRRFHRSHATDQQRDSASWLRQMVERFERVELAVVRSVCERSGNVGQGVFETRKTFGHLWIADPATLMFSVEPSGADAQLETATRHVADCHRGFVQHRGWRNVIGDTSIDSSIVVVSRANPAS